METINKIKEYVQTVIDQEVSIRVNMLILYTVDDSKFWDVGHLVRKNQISAGFRVFDLKNKEFISQNGLYKIIGWLPLPNPNDITL